MFIFKLIKIIAELLFISLLATQRSFFLFETAKITTKEAIRELEIFKYKKDFKNTLFGQKLEIID